MAKSALCLSLRFAAATLPFILANALGQTTSYSVIANMGIHPREGANPQHAVVFDRAGNLYGTTYLGGAYGRGTAFELIPKPDGYWTEKTIANFRVAPPNGPLAIDAVGHLYGTGEAVSGTSGQGVIFQLAPTEKGLWTRTDIYTFQATPNGNYPTTGIVLDKQGDLYGVSSGGGLYDGGTVFELSRQGDGSWAEAILYSNPVGTSTSGLTLDQTGHLYGIANLGANCSAFSLTKPEAEGGSWSYTTLHTFSGLARDKDNLCPNDMIPDSKGNLYGVSTRGGVYNFGAVVEIPAGGGVDGPDRILYTFNPKNYSARYPVGSLVIDHSGNIYGTTANGGPYTFDFSYGDGKIFELIPRKSGAWFKRTLYAFGGRTYKGAEAADGAYPFAGLVIGPDGNFYGTTVYGGSTTGTHQDENGYGTVFKFVVH